MVFDGSPVVDCSQPHTLETLTSSTLATSSPPWLLEDCQVLRHGAVADYVDSPGPLYNRAWPISSGPPRNKDAGQSWVRCDVGFWGRPPLWTLVSESRSLEGAMGEDIARYQQCLAEVPDLERSQPFVSCEEPHRAEFLDSRRAVDASKYPSAAKLEKRDSHCAVNWSPTVTTQTR